MSATPWYNIQNIDELDSPSFVVYPDRIKQNIKTLIESIDDVNRLRPHIKTHKSSEVSKMMLDAGIKKFKCATIAEAEMLATAKAPDVLFAYQPVGPKTNRLAALVKLFPETKWSCLIDNIESAKEISTAFEKTHQQIDVYVDLNVGMNRTGIVPQLAVKLFESCQNLKGLSIKGLHAYDGHLRDVDFKVRTNRCDEAFDSVIGVRDEIQKKYGIKLNIVAGGTPTYSIHSKRKEIECSPGTYIYWDKGYERILQEQHYLHAALVISRVISVPTENTICIDLGHKAIASENPLPDRVFFLNAPELEPIGHSEEHMVFKNTSQKKYKVGDVLYGVPFHICPTVALHDIAHVVTDQKVKEKWTTAARRRKIAI
jgi:D-serine deaminase-like pyridoxal phosphate-dependent protein